MNHSQVVLKEKSGSFNLYIYAGSRLKGLRSYSHNIMPNPNVFIVTIRLIYRLFLVSVCNRA